MSGVVPPLPEYALMAWRLVKHRDNFTFTFIWKIAYFINDLNITIYTACYIVTFIRKSAIKDLEAQGTSEIKTMA